MECGFWDRDMMTEDIAVTWKLEKNFWDVRYEPRALCWMLVPETFKGLWRQRKRWAEGGLEVIFRHHDIWHSWKRRRMTPIYLEQVCSFFWSVCWLVLTILLLIMEFRGQQVFTEYLWKSQFLSFVCLLQFGVAMWLEKHYDRDILKSTWSVIWYPLVYWYVNVFITLAALFKTILPKKKLATWKSPDRGITQLNKTEEDFVIEPQPPVKASAADLRMSRLVQAYSSDPENASLNVPYVDGTIENPLSDQKTDKHIENKVEQKTWKTLFEIVLTVIAWVYMIVYWTFMLYGIFCDLTNRPVTEFWIYNYSTIHQTEHYFVVLFIAILIETLLLILWKEYNYHRFGRLRRRKFKPDVTQEELDEYFNLNSDLAYKLHNDKYVEVLENPIPQGMGQGRKRNK